MINLAELSESDFEKMAQEITAISQSKSEKELFTLIGNTLHDSGMTISNSKGFDILTPKMIDQSVEKFSLKKSLNYVADTVPMMAEIAEEEGRRFWQRFKEKLKSTICTDSKIKDLITGNGTLKDYLIAGIPLILAALGMGALNPLLLAIIAASFALIVKVGFAAYCEIEA